MYPPIEWYFEFVWFGLDMRLTVVFGRNCARRDCPEIIWSPPTLQQSPAERWRIDDKCAISEFRYDYLWVAKPTLLGEV
jgi:hypothetical protein